MTIGSSVSDLQFDFIPGNSELGLSTGGPEGIGGHHPGARRGEAVPGTAAAAAISTRWNRIGRDC